jgi:hypothetical protein
MKYRIFYPNGSNWRHRMYGREDVIEMCRLLRSRNIRCWIAPMHVTPVRLRAARELLRPALVRR